MTKWNIWIALLLRSINGEEVQLLLKTADGKLMQLSAMPVSAESSGVLSSIAAKQQTVVIKTEPALRSVALRTEPKKIISSRLSMAKMVSDPFDTMPMILLHESLKNHRCYRS